MSDVMRIDVKLVVKGADIKTDLQAELLVADGDVNTHLIELPSRMLYYSTLLAEIARELKQAEDDFRVWLAQKKSAVASTSKSSETAKEDAVIVGDGAEYIGRKNKIGDLEYTRDILTSIVKAFDAKQYMLNALCTNYRTEMEKGIRIKEWNSKVQRGEVLG